MGNKILFPLDAFAEAMDERLALAHADGKQGWNDDCTAEYLSDRLVKNLLDNDLVSVANYCMFLWVRNEKFKLSIS